MVSAPIHKEIASESKRDRVMTSVSTLMMQVLRFGHSRRDLFFLRYLTTMLAAGWRFCGHIGRLETQVVPSFSLSLAFFTRIGVSGSLRAHEDIVSWRR